MAKNIFLKFDPAVDGEATDSDHIKWIDIESFSFGAVNAVDQIRGGARSVSYVNVQDLSLAKQYDISSPKLMEACMTGRHFKGATMEIWGQYGDSKSKWLEVKMEDVLVSSVATNGSSEGGRPMESLSLNFNKVEVEYTAMKDDGTEAGKMKAAYDIAEAKKI